MGNRSQRAVRYRDGVDPGGVAAYQRFEPSMRTPLEQRTALLALGQTTGVPPANTVAPALTGTLTVGQVQTVTNGTWVGQGSVTYTRVWYRGNTPIAGATGTTYTLVSADAGQTIFCRVRAADSYGVAYADSNIRKVP